MFITDETATTLKDVAQLIPNLDYLETASLLHAVADSIRQGQTLGDTLEELGVDIQGVTDGGCGLLSRFKDVSDEMELITLASFCTAHLMQAYCCI
ncbi:MAG: hypothetical protein KME49_25665 [Brasilonema octagenarum HA4186-MV1]|jgi:hypothetical protein|nr:hypothetical protein [Brasilonema octagenarum HA4186-MV1]